MTINKKFISLGIKYSDGEFKPLVNRKIYDDTNFPPTKPIKGGLWGSSYLHGYEYCSYWEKYFKETLNPELFPHRLNQPSTVFTIEAGAIILCINSFDDIIFKLSEKRQILASNLSLRSIKTCNDVPKQYEQHLFVDFENLSHIYDGLYVSQQFVSKVDWVLKEYKRRVLNNLNEFDEILTQVHLYKAELFEDWNVDSILIMNKNVIHVEGYIV